LIFVADISDNGNCLRNLEISIDEIWEIGEVDSKVWLYASPGSGVISWCISLLILLILEISSYELKDHPDSLCDSSDFPVSECWYF
jgi:hypothetical protein